MRTEGAVVKPASSISFTPAAYSGTHRFIFSIFASSTTLTTNSPVARTLTSVSFSWPFLAPWLGPTLNISIGGSMLM
ncbi:hypothetical protein D9M71_763530 [compost metagenome]